VLEFNKRIGWYVPFNRHLFVSDEKKEHTSVIMQPATHTQRILDLARKQGTIRPLDLDAIGAPRVALAN
jgi:hypothetical protein